MFLADVLFQLNPKFTAPQMMCERHSSLKMLFYKCVDSGCGDIFYQME